MLLLYNLFTIIEEFRMRPALSKSQVIERARLAMKSRPTFKIVGVRKQFIKGTKSKNFKVKCLLCDAITERDLEWLCSSKSCMCVKKAKFTARISLSTSEAERRANEHLKLKPTFRYVGLASESHPYSFNVECLDCKTVQVRSMVWLRSKFGCLCQKGSKISKAQRMTKAEFSHKWNLKDRKLKIVSKFQGMHRRVHVMCLRCRHKWHAAPTNLRKAGCPVCAPSVQRANNMEKYGVEHTLQRPDVRAKRAATMIKKHGHVHALQNPKLFQRMVSNSYRTKSYRLGKRTVQVQGYEGLALDWILKNTRIKASDIACGPDVPSVPYTSSSGKSKTYHPDFFVPKHNLVIEVKSVYTYNSRLEQNLLKAAACVASGYKFRFLVMRPDGSRIHVQDSYHRRSGNKAG